MRDETKNIALNLIASACWSMGVVLVAILSARLLPPDWNGREIMVRVDELVSLGIVLLFFITLLFLITLRLLRRTTMVKGREKAMKANGEMVERYAKGSNSPFWSTRVTHWNLSENSQNRLHFRHLISSKVEDGVPVRRLWQLKTAGDLKKLEEYLLLYQSYDNYSVKAIVSRTVLIPEILCIGDKAASIAFPEPASPRSMALTIQFLGRLEVEALRNYFEVLWELARPIKTGADLHAGTIALLRKELADPDI